MEKRWPIGRKGTGVSGIAGLPGTLVAVGLIIGLLYAFNETFRAHPLASWTPLLILVLLIPGVALSVLSELKSGKERGVFIQRGEKLLFEGSLFKSRIVSVEELHEQKEGYDLTFIDEQGRKRELFISRRTKELRSLLDELERLRSQGVS